MNAFFVLPINLLCKLLQSVVKTKYSCKSWDLSILPPQLSIWQ